MRDVFTWALVASTIRLATPLVLAALGGLFSERSGVINIALEGKMLAGAFAAAAMTYAADVRFGMGSASPWIGLLAGMLAGLFIAAIYAVSCIKFKADQVVSGAAINILMFGIPGFLSGALFLSSGSTPQLPKDHLLPQSPAVIAITVLVLVAVSWYVLYKTPFGLRLRSVGEKPEAADAAGVSVSGIRYSGVLLAGILAGIGGCISFDRAVVVVYEEHDVGPRFHRARCVDLREVAPGADFACVSPVWFHGGGFDSDARRGKVPPVRRFRFSLLTWCRMF